MRKETFWRKLSIFTCFLAFAAVELSLVSPAVFAEDPPILEVVPASLQVSSAAGEASFDVSNAGGGTMAWTTTADDLWLEILDGVSGTDTGAVSVGYLSNSGAQRTGTITITAPDAENSPQIVEIVQAARGPGVISHGPSGPVNILEGDFEAVTVAFDKTVDFDPSGTGSFWLDDISIEGPDGQIVPTEIVSLGGNAYEIGFPAQVATGIYRFAVGPEIEDADGNRMDQDRDGENGEAEDDVARFSLMVDHGERILWEGFEATYSDWTVENGVWEIGAPEAGPETAHEGDFVFGTVLDCNYPYQTDSRLASPEIQLPEAGSNQEVLLRFWHWFDYYPGTDNGQVQAQEYDETSSEWSEWETLETFELHTPVWTRARVDLTRYAGKTIRIGFYHEDIVEDPDGIVHHYEDYGWYIDDVEIVAQQVPLFGGSEDFESGWGAWYSDRGIWEIGEPGAGPGAAHSVVSCAATILDGDYPYRPASRLMSPEIQLPEAGSDEEVLLRFWHWFDYYPGTDSGQVQVQEYDETSSAWSQWETLGTFDLHTPDWTRARVELTRFAGKKIRLGFYHQDTIEDPDGIVHHYETSGWYIDDVEIVAQQVPLFGGSEDFESGWGDWYSDRGIWEIGEPGAGPGAAHGGVSCAATILDGDYPYRPASRLMSPEIQLPEAGSDEEVLLRFWHWFDYYPTTDNGQVQVREYDETESEWSEWQTLETLDLDSPVWSRARVDLTSFAGKRIRLGFYHEDTIEDPDGIVHYYEDFGWYIDDVEIVAQQIPQFGGTEDFESGWGDWYADRGLWEIGAPGAGPGSAHGGTSCAATILDGDYPLRPDSRLISPEMELPGVGSDEALLLRFMHWHAYESSDSGRVQVSEFENGSWSDWKSLGDAVAGSNGEWAQATPVDLTAYAGKKVRFCFFHEDAIEDPDGIVHHYENAGWYIDDVQISHFIPESVEIGEDFSGTFSLPGDRQYFSIEVPPGGNLQVLLDVLDDTGVYEVYLRHGALPSAGEYDYRFSNAGEADQEVFVPNATPGTWYVLVYVDSVGDLGEYTIQTKFSTGLMVRGIAPDKSGNSVSASIAIDGTGFEPSAQVSLVRGASEIIADEVSFVSAARLIADFDLAGVAAGSYELLVRCSESEDSTTFEVTEGGEAVFEAKLVVPGKVGYHNPATIWVEYANTGDVAMPAPLLVVTASQLGMYSGIMTSSEVLEPRGFWTSAMPEGYDNVVQFLAMGDTPGVLQAGESKSVPVQFAGWQKPWIMSYPPIAFWLGVVKADNNTPVDWDAQKDDMRPETISAETWVPIWQNFVQQVGTTWGDYVSMLTDNAIYLARLGKEVTDIADLLGFEFAQADGLSVVARLAESTDALVEAPGPDISFRRSYPQNIAGRYETGDLGRGWTHNWEMSLTVASDGTVTVSEPGGYKRKFQPDSRTSGQYFSMDGDFGTLVKTGDGSFQLKESDGSLRVFSSDGTLDYFEDVNGNRITAGYSDGKLSSLAQSSGAALQIVRDASGKIDSLTDPEGRTTRFYYDGSEEHLASVEYFDEAVVSYLYSVGNGAPREHALTEIEFPGGYHQYFSYDGNGRLSHISRDGGAESVSFSYSGEGRVTVTNALGHGSHFYLDEKGLLAKAVDPQENEVNFHYDTNFNLTEIIDQAGKTYFYDYDDCGNVVQMTDPLGHFARMAYSDSLNRLSRLIDAGGSTTRFGYDAKGNLASMAYDDASAEAWGYDDQGRATSWTNCRGDSIGYESDSSGRLTAKVYPDESRVEYQYDARGNLVSATDSIGTTRLEYDADDRMSKITWPGGRTLSYTYNSGGQRASMEDQSGHRLDYHYDAAGRLECISDENAVEIVRYSYDAAGRICRKELGNGVYTTYEYDDAGQLTLLANKKADGSILSRFAYAYDPRGRRTSMTTAYGSGDSRTSGAWFYEYDDNGQLVAWTAPDGRHVAYEYDPAGNRRSVADYGATTGYSANDMNQYVEIGDDVLSYDEDGNLVRRISASGTVDYAYDWENRLTGVTTPSSAWTYAYDAFGNRTRASGQGEVSGFVVDPVGFGNVVGEYDNATGDLKNSYDHGFGLVSSNGSAFYTFDDLGGASETTDAAGGIENQYAYAPFGETLEITESLANAFRFAGEFGVMRDASGLDFMRARHYEPGWGRFLSKDPAGLAGGDLNLYRYVANNPVQFVDPSGYRKSKAIQTTNQNYRINTGGWGNLDEQLRNQIPIEQLDPNYYKWKNSLDNPPDFGRTLKEIFQIDWKNGKLKTPSIPNVVWQALMDAFGSATPYNTDIKPPWDWTIPEWVDFLSELTRAWDPNQKSGPAGYGDEGLISANSTFHYKVEFENDETATAPAQIVTVSDPIDSDLDWITFSLAEIGFGDEKIAIPENTQHFENNVPMSQNGVNFEVRIEAGIHLDTGEAYANFYSIDPLTGLPPSVEYGFLPPEDGTGRGQGYFSYAINAKAGLAAGTEIRNVAHITFDYQDTIATNQVDPHDPSQGTDPDKECLNTVAPDEVTLTVAGAQGGAVENPGQGAHKYDWGESVELAAAPAEGFRFVKWTGDVDAVSDVYSAQTKVAMYDSFSISPLFEEGDGSSFPGCYVGAYLGCGSEDDSCATPAEFTEMTGKNHAIYVRFVDIADSQNTDHWQWAKNVPMPMFVYDPYGGLDSMDAGNVRYFAEKCRDFKRTVFIVFGHEMNATWYPWGNRPDEFIQKFKETAEIFHQIAPNANMCWVPNQNWGYPWDGGTDYGDGYSEYYPEGTGTYGDYVDCVGLNFYERDYDEDDIVPSDMFVSNIRNGQDGVDFYATFAAGKQKPMLISETGAFDANDDPADEGTRVPPSSEYLFEFKETWISQVYDVDVLKAEFPRLNAICYFHVQKTEDLRTENHAFDDIAIDYRIPDESAYDLLVQDEYFVGAVVPGDVDADGKVTLKDAAIACQIAARIQPSATIHIGADANADGRIGMEEAAYVIRFVSED